MGPGGELLPKDDCVGLVCVDVHLDRLTAVKGSGIDQGGFQSFDKPRSETFVARELNMNCLRQEIPPSLEQAPIGQLPSIEPHGRIGLLVVPLLSAASSQLAEFVVASVDHQVELASSCRHLDRRGHTIWSNQTPSIVRWETLDVYQSPGVGD